MQSIINQIQIKDYRNERIDIRYRRECEVKIDEHKENFNKMSIEINKITKENELRQREQAANLSIYTAEPSRRFDYIYDDVEESTIPLNEIVSQIPPSIPITPVLPIEDPKDSLIMRDEDLSTIPEKESVEFLSLVLRTLFQSHVSPRIHPGVIVLEDIESKASYDSNLDEPTLLVTLLSVSNEDECFDPGDDIEILLHRDPSTPKMSVVSILEGFTNESPLEYNDDLFDLESKEN
uniref:Uncharacterized protein n=1 Tax=Tanacetum cinerariifolium TaxID=118510 RepID=A0A699ITI7_TANCI|nr:hypothetical protein [Tanacetum cinerariifolium]